MKKKDLKKMALMGITGGVMLVAQGAVAAVSPSAGVTLAAAGCAGQSGRNYYTASEMDEGSLDPDAQRESSSCAGGNECGGMNQRSSQGQSQRNNGYEPEQGTSQPSGNTQTQNPSGNSANPNYYNRSTSLPDNAANRANPNNNGTTSLQDNAAKRANLNGR